MIRQAAIAAENPGRLWRRHLPAFLISFSLHGWLLLGIFLYTFLGCDGSRQFTVVPENQIIETRVEDAPPVKHAFDVEDIGLDPDKPISSDAARLDDVAVPGKIVPDAVAGIEGAPEGPPQSVPPPPGFGGGQGGGLESDVPGAGQMFGQAGGLMGGRSLPGVAFAGRSAASRDKMLSAGGGNAASEAAVAKGLNWLVRTQNQADGRWTLGQDAINDDVAATGLALLPFLAAGQTHKAPKGEKESPYAKTVERGLNFLKTQQRSTGCFGNPDRGQMMYGQAIATMAVCEAYGMTQDAGLKRTAQLALDYLVKAQHSVGGFRYKPGQAGDTSVTGWCLQALKSGYLAGLNVPRDTMTKVGNFLDTVQSQAGGAYAYQPNRSPSPNMVAVGLLCRQYLGWGPKNPGLVTGIENLNKNLPSKETAQRPDLGMYYFYYATQVAHFYGGEVWHKVWNPKIRDLLIETQDNSPDAKRRGSWPPDKSTTGRSGGRHAITCLALLTLEVYYRHLPLYRRDASALKDLD
jgi:hypothetical protein